MSETKIEWTQRVWNPVRGCSLVSAGCRSCYAMRQAHRFSGPGRAYEGLTKMTPAGPQWTGKVRLVPEALDEPLRWRKPARVFVNSMSDLFHDDVPDDFIDRVFAVMALAPRHTFQILTKRPARMRDYFAGMQSTSPEDRLDEAAVAHGFSDEAQCQITNALHCVLGEGHNVGWPMRNVWLGVSVEDQRAADERIPLLLKTPAAVRFLSCEPMIGPVDLDPARCDTHGEDEITDDGDACNECIAGGWSGELSFGHFRLGDPDGIDWVIVGGESGPSARPCDVAWVRSIVEQCKAADVPAFVKQLGSYVVHNGISHPGKHWPPYDGTKRSDYEGSGGFRRHLDSPKGGDPSEWPEDLRVREFPAEVRS